MFRKIINRIEAFFKRLPYVAENGDVYGEDNDRDGKIEKNYREGYKRKNGAYVRSHYTK